jgi:ubiquitin
MLPRLLLCALVCLACFPVCAVAAELPSTDDTAGYVTAIVHDASTPAEENLVAVCNALRPVAAVNVYRQSNRHYRQRLASENPTVPAMVAQSADGQLIYKQSGEALPKTREAAAAVCEGIRDVLCPDGKCGPRKAPPKEEPKTTNVHIDPLTIEVVKPPAAVDLPVPPKTAPSGNEFAIVLVLAMASAAAIAIAVKFTRRVNAG